MPFIKITLITLLLLLCLAFTVLMLAIDNEPLVEKQTDITPEHIARGKRILQMNDPRRLRSGSTATAVLERKDIDLALNYFVNQATGGVAEVTIVPSKALIVSTFELPAKPFGSHLNLTVELKQTNGLPKTAYLKLGRLTIPGALVDYLIEKHHDLILPDAEWQALSNLVKRIGFIKDRLIVTYQWQDHLPATLSGTLLSEEEIKRIKLYQQHLKEVTQNTAHNRLNLTELTHPLFKLATIRSRDGDPVAENRAVILVLTLYVNRLTLNRLIPALKSDSKPVWHSVNLNHRNDLTKHYLVSAALSAYAGTPLADAIGLFKELEDSKGGSGFSFNDLAANRAGTLMGELAVKNDYAAQKIQTLMASAEERDFMPETADLPEHLAERDFKRIYGGLQGKAYRKMIEKIEARIAELVIYREL